MSNPVLTCPVCGQKIPPSVGECLYCPAPESGKPSASPNPFSPSPAPAATVRAEPTPAQLLLVAEECLARAQPEKAADLASRALSVHPDSLEAKALVDRARRQLARQRRRGRQEERLKEAAALLEAADLPGAERVVDSVLKRMPGHPEALALLGRLKGRRLPKGDAEAEAEQELAQLGQGQARRAAEAARVARAAGWEGKAMLALRRGLRLVPDDPELLDLLRETQRALGEFDRAGTRRRAANAQVRMALDHLNDGLLEESLKRLRSLLRQDPDHARAQAAVQEVRRVWLARNAPPTRSALPAVAPPTPAAPPAVPPAPAAAPVAKPSLSAPLPLATPSSVASSPVAARTTTPPPPAPRPALLGPEEMRRRVATGAAIVPPRASPPLAPAPVVRHAPAPEIARARPRKGTPLLLVVGSATLVIALLLLLTSRPAGRSAPVATPAAAAPSPTRAAAPETPPPAGPLAGADPEVREAVEATLASYAHALESQDAELLARVRPDLTAAERERLLARFRGAINVATDLRVLDVIPRKGFVVVPVLRTDVIVGGRGGPAAPVEETLRFERRDGAWRLAAASAR